MLKFKNGVISEYDNPYKINLIPKSNTTSRPQLEMYPMYITVHNTANPGASAKANSDYVNNASGYVSWHFTVGDRIVYQELPIDEVAWAAGDGYNGPGNRKSIHIEIAEVDNAYETAVQFIKDLMEYLDFDTTQVVPHKKWSGKNCPRLILPKWDQFIEDLTEVNYKALYEEANAKLQKIKEIL